MLFCNLKLYFLRIATLVLWMCSCLNENMDYADILRVVIVVSRNCVVLNDRLYHRKYRPHLKGSQNDVDFICGLLKKEIHVYFPGE